MASFLFVPMIAVADDMSGFVVEPFQFGLGAFATWARDAGEPGQKGDQTNFGLYLQKHTKTLNFAASGAVIKKVTPIPATSLNALAFKISGDTSEGGVFTAGDVRHGYCGAGAPRFNVDSGSGTCFLGCAAGDKTQSTTTGWWEVKFAPPFTQYAGCGGVTGTVTNIAIVFDEGDDVPVVGGAGFGVPQPGTMSPGDVVLDNIRVNNDVVGNPGEQNN
jgi:hypothetical protein